MECDLAIRTHDEVGEIMGYTGAGIAYIERQALRKLRRAYSLILGEKIPEPPRQMGRKSPVNPTPKQLANRVYNERRKAKKAGQALRPLLSSTTNWPT